MTEVVDRYPKAQRTFPVAVERQREINEEEKESRKMESGRGRQEKWSVNERGWGRTP